MARNDGVFIPISLRAHLGSTPPGWHTVVVAAGAIRNLAQLDAEDVANYNEQKRDRYAGTGQFDDAWTAAPTVENGQLLDPAAPYTVLWLTSGDNDGTGLNTYVVQGTVAAVAEGLLLQQAAAQSRLSALVLGYAAAAKNAPE